MTQVNISYRCSNRNVLSLSALLVVVRVHVETLLDYTSTVMVNGYHSDLNFKHTPTFPIKVTEAFHLVHMVYPLHASFSIACEEMESLFNNSIK